jgi:hypothetical protein
VATPNYTFQLIATPIGGTSGLAKGNCVVKSSGAYVLATTANRSGGERSSGVLVGAAAVNGGSVMQSNGDVPPEVTSLPAGGGKSWVICNASGTLERKATPVTGDDVVGWCENDGTLHAHFGFLTAEIIAGGGGGSTASTFDELFGDDFVHFWGGDYDATTGTWPDAVGSADATVDDVEIPTAVPVNGHESPCFNGVDQALSVGIISPHNGLSSYAIFGAYKTGESPAFGGIFGKAGSWGVEIDGDGTLIAFNNNASNFIQGTTPTNDNGWHRFILNVVGNAATLYIDGVADATATWATVVDTVAAEVWIGRQAVSTHFAGRVTALGIATRGLTAAEVEQLDDLLVAWLGMAAAVPIEDGLVQERGIDETYDASTTQIGKSIPLVNNAHTIVDVQARALLGGATKNKTFNIRREFLNEAGAITADAQQTLLGPIETGGAQTVTVALEYTGTTARIDVAGAAVRWMFDVQIESCKAGPAPPVAPFDRADLGWDGWWTTARGGDYTGSPWTSTASAGSSGGRTLTEGFNPPTVGPNLNTFASAHGDAVDNVMVGDDLDVLISPSQYSGFVLCQVNTIGGSANDAAPYNNAYIIGQTAVYYWGISTTSDGGNRVQVWQYDSTSWKTVAGLAITLGTPFLLQFKYAAGTLQARINRGTWQSVAAGPVAALNPLQLFGPSFTGAYAAADVWEKGLTGDLVSDADFDSLVDDINADYLTSF